MDDSRPLEVSPPIRRQLVRCQLVEGNEEPPMLDMAQVRRVEAELGVRLPDDILAVFATPSRLFGQKHGMRLDRVLEHTEQLRRGTGGNAFIGVGEHPIRQARYGIERDWETPLFIFEVNLAKKSAMPWGLESWLEYEIGGLCEMMLLDGTPEEQERSGRVPTNAQLDAFEIRLVHDE